jgi:UDP-N-acetylmuramate dehydrogenase
MNELQQLIYTKFAQFSPQFDVPLAPVTYMKIGGPAEVLLDLKKRQDIIDVVTFCQQNSIHYTIFGGASNVIVVDEGIKGVVICVSNEEYQVLPQQLDGGTKLVQVGAGHKTALFVRQTIEDGLQGLEYFLGVPGKLGGAIYNNAHYANQLIGQYIRRVEVIKSTGEVAWMTNAECQFAYDYSIFHYTHDVILQAEFMLMPGNKEQSLQLIKEATVYRSETQPIGQPSSGCYFRNVVNTPDLQRQFPEFAERREFPSAFLIDQAGLKNQQVGGVRVSEKHAAFFVNDGTGTSNDVRQLAEIVKSRVLEQYGVELKEEVFFLS